MKLYQNLNVTGSLTLTGSLNTIGTITATTLVVQTITSSISAITGSTKFGELSTNTHQFTGSVNITGSLAVVTTGTEFQVTNTGVNLGNALTDNHIISGSTRINPNGLFISSSGQVGIGTITPKAFLEINSFNGNMRLYNASGVTNNHISTNMYWNGSSWARDISAGMANIVIHPTAGIIFNTTGSTTSSDISERMRITADGLVGIGTGSPITRLQVIANTPTYLYSPGQLDVRTQENQAANKGAMISIGGNATGNNTPYNFGIIGAYKTNSTVDDFSSYMIFGTSDVYSNVFERMRITTGGNVLIGTITDNSYKLAVASGTQHLGAGFVVNNDFTTTGRQCATAINDFGGTTCTFDLATIFPRVTFLNRGLCVTMQLIAIPTYTIASGGFVVLTRTGNSNVWSNSILANININGAGINSVSASGTTITIVYSTQISGTAYINLATIG
jgi:hypothetical protein